MRRLILATLACLAFSAAAEARSVRVHTLRVHVGHGGAAAAILVHEGILTRAQLACSQFRPGRVGSWRVQEVAVFERHGGRCPGPPQPPTFLFNVYVDRISGVVDYTPETSEELKTILPLPHHVLAD
jgi:hypothetical protein